MKKLALTMAAVLTLSMGLTACGGDTNSASTATPNEPSANAKQLAVQIGPDPETIDPALCTTIDAGNMIIHAFEALNTIGEDGSIVPGQAESFTVSEDGLVYTFILRDGLKWSDGSALTSEDFVYSWKRAVSPDTAAPYGNLYDVIAGYDEAAAGDAEALGVKAVDAKTLEVTLSAPCVYFDQLVAFSAFSPVQKATIEANGDSWATQAETYISNGAFNISEWVPGEYLLMSKNTNYWNAEAINLDTLKFVLMEDANASLSAYESGEIMLVKDIPSAEVQALSEREDYYLNPILGSYYISLNLEKEPFQNADVRKALSLAIDREFVANTVMQGTYTAAGNLVGPGLLDNGAGTSFNDVSKEMNGGTEYVDTTNFDANLAEAKELLTKAGFPNGEGLPVLEYASNDAGYHVPLAEALQQMWAEIGVTLEIQVAEWNVFSANRRSGDFMVGRNGWVCDYNDPSSLLKIFMSDDGNNDGNYASEEFDAAMDKAAASQTNPEEYFQSLHDAEKILLDDHGMIPIAYYNDFYLQSEKLQGTWHSPLGQWHLMYAEIAE